MDTAQEGSYMQSIDAVTKALAEQNYVCGRALSTVAFLTLKLGRPLIRLQGLAEALARREDTGETARLMRMLNA